MVFRVTPQAHGSIETGQEYTATTTDSGEAGRHLVARSSGAACALGSVTVASSSGTTFEVWNATSTTDIASTSLLRLKASVAEGTYTLGAACPRGLIIAAPTGFNGSYVTTYR